MKIAVIGSGISGLAAAWALHGRHDVTVYEKDARLGGHSHTVDADYDGVRIPVDTGFIVYNELTYPNLTALFAQLGVATEASSMTFSVSVADGSFEWGGPALTGLFAQKRRVVDLRFHRMWMDILRFNKIAPRDLAAGHLRGLSLGSYLALRGFSTSFRRDYLIPMGAAIWSTNPEDMLDYPAESFLRFLENHRLTSLDWPVWRTVSGGSRAYVAKLSAPFRHKVRAATPVTRILRDDESVTIDDANGGRERFDHAIVAAHSPDALALLTDASAEERAILGAMRYAPNTAVLHRDATLMPRRRAAWASWNYICAERSMRREAPTGAVSVTYWMNRLQNLDRKRELFVSLNPLRMPDPEKTFASFSYDHPQFDRPALAAQRRLHEIQGVRRTWFCGAYAGFGFHEDGLTSGLEVASRLGATVPWGAVARPRIFPALAEAAE